MSASPMSLTDPRPLWQPDPIEQLQAAETLLCSGIHSEARQAVRQRMTDWLDHAQGCRQRAKEYRAWAIEDEAAGRPRAAYYHKAADRSWRSAFDAVRSAKHCRQTPMETRAWL